ncbi:MAG: hypothetical protein NZ866_01340 [Patescibacteria group bacterium]|nr:hypothetical protein [Patescibacteria group bacterium]
MKVKIIFFLFIIIFLANLTEAQVYKFFEFAPDLGKKFLITPEEEFVQKFIPFNDFLSMIKIWIENPERITIINFQLIDNQNNILENKNVTIPQINLNWSGTPFDIPLSSNLRINSGQIYKFKIRTQNENSSLKIFTFNLLELLQNIESFFNLPETIQALEINNHQTEYSFKIALFEGIENLPPVISNLNYRLINTTTANIYFNANEPIKYELQSFELPLSTPSIYQNNYFENCPENIRNCSINISINLEKEYFIKIKIWDYWQNSTTAEINFNTYSNRNNNYSNRNQNNYSQNIEKQFINQESINQQHLLSPTTTEKKFLNKKDQEKKEIYFKKDKEITTSSLPIRVKQNQNSIFKNNQKEIEQKQEKIKNNIQEINKDNNKKTMNNKKEKEDLKFQKDEEKKLNFINQNKNGMNYFKVGISIISLLIIIFVIIGSFVFKNKK